MAADDHFVYYRYDPTMAGAVLFIILFALVTFLHTYQLLRTRTWYFIPFVIGGYFEWVGYIGRALSSHQTPNWTLGPFILQTLLILIAPALFAASMYMELGRIIRLTDGAVHSVIKLRWLTKIFVMGDVLSFLMQASGGGLMSSGDSSSVKTGENIIVGGLAVQILFFGFFIVVSMIFNIRINKTPTSKILGGGRAASVWKKHLYTLYSGSLLILVRSIFRIIEYEQGNDGYLISHEVFLYIFDAVLMFVTMVLFALVHPSEVNALLRGDGRGKAVHNVVSIYEMDEAGVSGGGYDMRA
ncbi:hypothetical protein LTS17_012486 [Exophiala oligosperma]